MSDTPLIRLAAIGCGGHATRRVFPCFARLPVRLVGVCDLDEARANENARRFGGERAFTSVERMLDETRPDGVVVCIGPQGHVAMSLLALERGIPVYTEKPSAATAEDAWRVADAARRAGKLAMAAYKYRYSPAMRKIQAIMATEEFGALSAINVLRVSGKQRNDPNDPRTQFLLDFCCHPIDMIRCLAGDPAEVMAFAPTPESYAISARFRSGAVGSFTFSCRGSWTRPVDRTELLGAQGHVITVDDQIFMRYHVEGEQRGGHEPKFCTSGGDSLEETGFVPELRAFVEHLQGRRGIDEIPSRIEESARSMEFYEAIRRSVETGRPQTVPTERGVLA